MIKPFRSYRLILAVALAAFASAAVASDMCATLSEKLSKDWGRPVPCFCGKTLSNLQATPPPGLRIEAACGLITDSGRWIDLTKERASLDKYDERGNLPEGEIYLSGRITRTGTVGMEPSNSGDLGFSTKCKASGTSSFLNSFCAFKLGSDDDYMRLGGPKHDLNNDRSCWSMGASLDIIDPVVRMSGTDGAGTYPRHIVVRTGAKPVFSKCYE